MVSTLLSEGDFGTLVLMGFQMRMKAIERCRICRSGQFRELFDLGQLHSCGIFPRLNEADPSAGPLNLIQCAACGLVQLAHDFAGEDLFRSTYGYRSGLNESMVKHLSGITAAVQHRVVLKDGDVVLDIGSNDGTLLSSYTVPPALFASASIRRSRASRNTILPASSRSTSSLPRKIFDAFAHLNRLASSPASRCSTIFRSRMILSGMSPAFLLPTAFGFLSRAICRLWQNGNSFDTICHEHLEYYCLRQIVDLVERHGLRVFDVSLNEVNGGSFQVWVCHADAPYPANTDAVASLLGSEEQSGYAEGTPILALKARINSLRDDVLEFLSSARQQGKLVHGYGASTKGNTLLQFFGITPELMPAIAERNEEKFGCRTPGTNIPIISEEESRAARPDYYFVLPWHFRDAFLKREREFIERGGRFVFPLPNLEIVPAHR